MNNFIIENEEVNKYFKILSKDFPEWILDYINTPEMQRIDKISLNCGTDYAGCFHPVYWYSNLTHSIGVALIIWNFTKDKKQTLAGLFHDIATPVFKHAIDFMNGDHAFQESTEEKTSEMIKNSPQIMFLLNRDDIKVEEVDNYHIYPIADNDTPRLSADRLEYTFSSGLSFYRIWDLELIEKYYNDIVILKDENRVLELGFLTKSYAEEYISIVKNLWPKWNEERNNITLQFLADICESMIQNNYIKYEDLYKLTEEEMLDKIKNCKNLYIVNAFNKFTTEEHIFSSGSQVKDKYCVKITGKKRYLDPLVVTAFGPHRISKLSQQTKNQINHYLKNSIKKNYTYFNFEFDKDKAKSNK